MYYSSIQTYTFFSKSSINWWCFTPTTNYKNFIFRFITNFY